MLKEGAFTGSKFRKLFICQILGWLVYMLGTMADSVIAGLYLDSEAVSAVGLVAPLVSICYFFAVLFNFGGAILFSRTLGAFQYEKSRKIAGMNLMIAIVLSLLTTTVLVFRRGLFLQFYGVTGNLYTYTDSYYTPIILVCAVYPLMQCFYFMVNFDGDEKIILLVDILQSVLNAVFSVILVQRMGTAGLGYGTFLGNATGALFLSIHFLKKSNSIRFKLYFSWRDFLEFIKCGSAFALLTLYMGIVDIIFNKLVIVWFTESYLPAYTVINTVMNLAAVLNCTISCGSIFATVEYGENNTHALKRTMRLTHRYTIGSGLVVTAIVALLAGVWPSVYGIIDPEVAAAAEYAGRIIPLFFLAAAFVYTYSTYYPIVGKFIEGDMLMTTYMLVGPLVLAAPLGKIFGFRAMGIGFALTPVFALLITFLYILVTGQIKSAPLLVKPTDEAEAHFDFRITPETILEVRDGVAAFLQQQNVDSGISNKVQILLEDSLGIIMKKNPRPVLCECSVLVNDARIRVITKDNGKVFDLVKEADDTRGLEAYVLARLMADSKEATNSVTISFNRNICIWER